MEGSAIREPKCRECNFMRTKRLAGSRRCMGTELRVRFHRRGSVNEKGQQRITDSWKSATAPAAASTVPANVSKPGLASGRFGGRLSRRNRQSDPFVQFLVGGICLTFLWGNQKNCTILWIGSGYVVGLGTALFSRLQCSVEGPGPYPLNVCS